MKNGTRKGKQLYKCDGCEKQFRDTGATNGRHIAADHIGAAIRMFYSGMSYKQIAEAMEKMYDIPEPSKQTIYAWVKKYTDDAVEQMRGHKARVGDEWVADELAVDVGGWQMWIFNVMDEKTRYILASHLGRNRDLKAARAVMQKAKDAAVSPTNTIKTDKLRSYVKAIEEVFPETLHIKSQGIRSTLNNNMSERLQGAYRSRVKRMRGMDSVKTAQHYLDGWTIQYNHFRDHESADGKPPGVKAKVNPPFEEWADVVKGGTTPVVLPKQPRPKARLPKIQPPKIGRTRKTKKAAMLESPVPPDAFATLSRALRPCPRDGIGPKRQSCNFKRNPLAACRGL